MKEELLFLKKLAKVLRDQDYSIWFIIHLYDLFIYESIKIYLLKKKISLLLNW